MANKKGNKGKRPVVSKKTNEGSQGTAVVLFGAALLVFFLVVFKFGSFWEEAHNYLLGIFGWTSYVIPFYMGYIAFSVSKGSDGKSKAIVIESAAAIFLLGVITDVIALGGDFASAEIMSYSQNAYDLSAKGGGWLASFLAYPLTYALTKPGAVVVLVIVIAVLIMLITRLTVAKLMRGMSKPVKKIRDDMKDAYREYRDKTEEEETGPVYPQNSGDDLSDAENGDIDIPLDGENRRKMKAAEKKKRSEELNRKRERLHSLYNGDVSAEQQSNVDNNEEETEEDEGSPSIDDILKKIHSKNDRTEREAEVLKPEDTPEGPKQTELKSESPIKVEVPAVYNYPPISLLEKSDGKAAGDDSDLKSNAEKHIKYLL